MRREKNVLDGQLSNDPFAPLAVTELLEILFGYK